MIEGLYVVEFGDAFASGLRNGGVAVLETNRIFGGDSGYYYHGKFSVKDGRIDANVRIVKHNPAWGNAFGDATDAFTIQIVCAMSGDTAVGQMERVDRPGIRLPIRFTKKADLP
jgi:hypothetical protein